MNKINKILLAMAGDSREMNLLQEAIRFKKLLGSMIDIVHVNDLHAGEMSMMMDSPKKITEDMILNQIDEYGLQESLSDAEIIITKNESLEDAISTLAIGYDLVIVGHRKMGEIIENISDSIDQDITNEVLCPVLVINKDITPKE